MADETRAPVVADRRAGEVSADLADLDETIARPARWVASLLWVVLVVALALVMVGSAAAMILDYLAPSDPPARTETMITLYVGAQGALVGLFVARPGSR